LATLRSRISGANSARQASVTNGESFTDGLPEPGHAEDRAAADPAGSVNAAPLSLAAVIFGLVGAVGAIRVLPSLVLAAVVALFVLLGPGSLALSCYSRLPAYTVAALVPAVGVAITVLAVAGLLMFGIYSPVETLLALTSATVIGGLLRWAYLVRRSRSSSGSRT
jgi:hypothetical protein